MQEFSEHILKSFQVRKSRKQKTRFIALLQSQIPELQVEEGGFFKSRNLVAGNLQDAKIILTAHYDTCARMPIPNFIAPKNIPLTVLYSLVLLVPMILIMAAADFLLAALHIGFWGFYWVNMGLCLGLILLLLIGPHNPHTANDNTSGVITLYEIYCSLTPEQRKKVLFVFFDLEEAGLLGSGRFHKVHKKELSGKTLINFDCVSDGSFFLTALSKSARNTMGKLIEEAFQSEGSRKILLEKAEKVMYPSDQAHFPNSVAVAALKKKRFIGFYMDRIHTPRDVIFDRGNIEFLVKCVKKLVESL